MHQIRAILVDDEPLALRLLATHLERFPQVTVVGRCSNGREAIEMNRQLKPDVMFLDIQMPGLSGLEVVSKIQSDIMPMVVFVTAYDQFAVKAFEVNAVDYLVKPVDPARLREAVQRLLRSAANVQSTNNKSSLINAAVTVSETKGQDLIEQPQLGKLIVRDGGEVHLIPFDDIDWIDAAGDYMCIHSCNDTHVMRITMKELEERLQNENFVRIHRSTIVNIHKIESIQLLTKGECELQLPGNVKLKVSRNYRANIKHLLS